MARSKTNHKIGDQVTIPGKAASAMVRLPDGSVTTVRGHYTIRHPGKHALITVIDGVTRETGFTADGPTTDEGEDQ